MMNKFDTISMNVAMDKERHYTERILGSVKHRFYYYILRSSAEYQVPNRFNLEEKILCKLLYQNPLSKETINKQLGLSKIAWLEDFMQDTLTKLSLEHLIEEKEGIYSLTSIGEEAILNGYKSHLETKSHIILCYFQELQKIGSDNKLWIENPNYPQDFPKNFAEPDIEDIDLFRQLANEQCPEIHCPANGYFLMRLMNWESTLQKSLDLQIFLLHDFVTNKIRAIAYDIASKIMLPSCSTAITENEKFIESLLQEIIREQERKELIEIGHYKKSQKQIDREKNLVESGKSDISNFSPLEFEEELRKIFNEKHETIVIFSPWIKRSSQYLLPLFRKFLKNGGNLYLCYSETEENKTDENDLQVINKIEELKYASGWPSKEYPKSRFMLTRDKPFHQKWVFVIDKNRKVVYSGSYNILSFSVNQHTTTIRQEDMNMVNWCPRFEQKYQEILEKTRE